MINLKLFCQRQGFTLDVELNIPSQGVTALLGTSGSGKTTLLRAIAGLDRHANATVKIDNTIWQNQHVFLPVHRRRLAYVFQEDSCFSHLNVAQNIAYGFKRLKVNQRRVSLDEVIELMNLSSLLTRMPHQLSGGERQRVAIARALATSPELLLMDEPLAALDQTHKQEIIPYIDTLSRRLSLPIIYVSHYPDEVSQLADYGVLINQGGVQAQGPLSSLFTRLDLPLSHQYDASAIIDASVNSYDDDYDLYTLKFSGGDLWVSACRAVKGECVKVKLAARDVSISLKKAEDSSILNIFPAKIITIYRENNAQLTVQLIVGEDLILAKITCKSAQCLNLVEGMNVFVQVKALAVLA